MVRACLERGIFSCENELIPVKFLRNSCEIPAFQTDPKWRKKTAEKKINWRDEDIRTGSRQE